MTGEIEPRPKMLKYANQSINQSYELISKKKNSSMGGFVSVVTRNS